MIIRRRGHWEIYARMCEEEAVKAAELEVEERWERNPGGVEREWVTDRDIEDITQRKRWLVIAILNRR